MNKLVTYSILAFALVGISSANADLSECLQEAEDTYVQCKDNGGGEVGCQAKKDKAEAQCTLDHDS